MKTIFAEVIAVSVIIVALRARAQVGQTISETGTKLIQGESVNSQVETKVAAPTRGSVSTPDLLKALADDETANHTWFNDEAKVPANAKLIASFPGPGNFSNLSYKVVSGNVTVDVSNILTASRTGSNDVNSATYTDAGGTNEPPFTLTDYHQFTISYDGRLVGGHLHYIVTGLATCTAKTTKPTKNGKYTETDNFTLTDGTGGGIDSEGVAFLLSGVTVTGTGSEPLILVQPSDVPQGGDGFFSTGAGDEQVSAPTPPVGVATSGLAPQ